MEELKKLRLKTKKEFINETDNLLFIEFVFSTILILLANLVILFIKDLFYLKLILFIVLLFLFLLKGFITFTVHDKLKVIEYDY